MAAANPTSLTFRCVVADDRPMKQYAAATAPAVVIAATYLTALKLPRVDIQ